MCHKLLSTEWCFKIFKWFQETSKPSRSTRTKIRNPEPETFEPEPVDQNPDKPTRSTRTKQRNLEPVVLAEVVPETAMEVEDNHDPAGSEVLTAAEHVADNEDEGRIVQGGFGTKIFIFDQI